MITDKGVDNNYKYTWEINDNSEVILANQTASAFNGGNKTNGDWQFPWGYWGYPYIDWAWGRIGITQTFIEKFYDKKPLPMQVNIVLTQDISKLKEPPGKPPEQPKDEPKNTKKDELQRDN